MSDVLFGNNNKAVIKKVANRNFHSNKKRNILAVIRHSFDYVSFDCGADHRVWCKKYPCSIVRRDY